MSQETINTNLSDCFHNEPIEDYFDDIFKEIPLNVSVNPAPEQSVSDIDILENRIRWFIEHMVGQIKYKAQMKRMLLPIMEIAQTVQTKDKIFRNVLNLKIMLKHSEIKDIVPLMTETIFMLIFPPRTK